MYAIEFNNVWKKFQKGEKAHSLRDGIPMFFKNMFSGNKESRELSEEEFWAVKNVDFRVKKGEVLGIIGPNGAGKSTILKLLSRIMKPTKGTFKIQGRLSALIEVTAGFHPEFTGRENIYFNGSVLGMSRKEIDARFNEIVEFSGVGDFIDTPVKRYSSGMSARLGFAIAAHVNPDVLLVDEVLSVGDMTFQAKCTAKMRELLNSGVTIIFISHNIPLVQSLCERVILLNKGEILKQGDPDEVIPYYENLVNAIREGELKRSLDDEDPRLEVKDRILIRIPDVTVSDESGIVKENFKSTESLRICIDYQAWEKIINPIFIINVVRSDGVICFACNTLDDNYAIESIEGEGRMEIRIKAPKLGPNVYYVKTYIMDRDMIHPYAIAKKGVFTIDTIKTIDKANAVLRVDSIWSHQKKK
ncbi:MAG: ABC transporter ATP-binding protein [Candidatus Omnitrophica bacterium]|nr:ABC transporter ATP-binding protein [Candidatus Omnitrophota bacterium]MCB9746946.1 ABC transporter ATP-binding protein [Candidatus Omnitrophota bacterium]